MHVLSQSACLSLHLAPDPWRQARRVSLTGKVAQDPCSLNSVAKFFVGMLSCKALIRRILNIDFSKSYQGY